MTDREKLIEMLNVPIYPHLDANPAEVVADYLIDNGVTVQKHGRWIYHECVSSYDGAISGYACSECNAFVNEEIFDTDEFHKDFCGNCGAKMDLEG